MPTTHELRVDVTDAFPGESLDTVATVVLPDPATLGPTPVVCVGLPGAGYGRGYFTFDMPGGTGGGEAGFHARRGWVFVACDHPGVGDSDLPSDAGQLTLTTVPRANAATVAHALSLLQAGTLAAGFPALPEPVVLGIGQSMGGCFTILQQAEHSTYDGIGVLGFSAIHTVLPTAPGAPEDDPFRARDDGLPFATWAWHYDDVPPEVVATDMRDYPTRNGRVPEWGSATIPPCAAQMVEPGCVSREAASVTVPVFVGVGERDVCPDPYAEPSAYRSSRDITLVVCPRMAHMHNFASTRVAFWERLHLWGETVAATTAATRAISRAR